MKLKPIDHDVHLKYLCPKCGGAHWLSFKEASTVNYKIVCYCGKVFKVQRVEKFQLKYHKKIASSTNEIPQELLNKCVSAFIHYGFTKEEAIRSISESYLKNPVSDHIQLVKQTLASMRTSNE